MAPNDYAGDVPVPEWQQRAEYDLDRALRTLSFAVDFAGAVERKTVVLHSARVGLLLGALGYSRDVQVAGALHNLIQETRYPLHDVAHDFGDDVAYLVAANTYDPAIEDWTEQYEEGLGRCIEAGAAAAIVKAADLYDDAVYSDLAWLAKPRYFLEQSQRLIGHEPVWRLLRERVVELEQCLRERESLAGDEEAK
jgi:hypothetical protein